jgi:hypothetical protein
MFDIFKKKFILMTLTISVSLCPSVNTAHRRADFVSQRKPSIVVIPARAGSSVKKETKADLLENVSSFPKINSISQIKAVFDNPSQFGDPEKDKLINELIEEGKAFENLSEKMKEQLFLFKATWENISQKHKLKLASEVRKLFNQLKLQKKQLDIEARKSLILENRIQLGINALGVGLGAVNSFFLTGEFIDSAFDNKSILSKLSFANQSFATVVQTIPAIYNLCKSISTEICGNKKRFINKKPGLALSGITSISGLISGGCGIAKGITNENNSGKFSRTVSTLLSAIEVGSNMKHLARLGLDASISKKHKSLAKG